MKDFFDFISSNPLYAVIVLVLAAIAIKEVYEFYQWAKSVLNDWYINRSNKENKDKNLSKEIEKLKTYVNDDKAQIRGLELHLTEIDATNEELKNSIKDLSVSLRDIRLDNMRSEILDAVPKCIDLTHSNVGSEDYTHLFQIYTVYEEILAENNLENSQLDLAMKMIKDSYRKRLAAELLTDYRYLPPEQISEKIRKADDAISWWNDENDEPL